jgi:hypothetical protein
LWPAFVEAESVGDLKWAVRTLSWGSALCTALALAAAILIIIAGRPMLVWWLRSDIGIEAGLLVAAGAWIVVMCVPRVAALLLSATLMLRPQLIAASGALAVAISLKWALAARFGVVGILAATPTSWFLIMWPAYIYLTLRWHKRALASASKGILSSGDMAHGSR